MKMLAASAATLVFLCAPALADSPPRPEDWPSIGTARRCEAVNQRHAGHEVERVACAASDGYGCLDITWSTRSSSSEYHAMTGTTADLGSKPGPRLEVSPRGFPRAAGRGSVAVQ